MQNITGFIKPIFLNMTTFTIWLIRIIMDIGKKKNILIKMEYIQDKYYQLNNDHFQ